MHYLPWRGIETCLRFFEKWFCRDLFYEAKKSSGHSFGWCSAFMNFAIIQIIVSLLLTRDFAGYILYSPATVSLALTLGTATCSSFKLINPFSAAFAPNR